MVSMIDVKDQKKTPEEKNATYEDDLDELTRLVDQIGEEDCPVDQLESKVRRAADLIRSLRERLSATETTVREVLGDLEVEDREGQ
jgi:exodeoxyribonuclease VII small subunit